MRKLLSISEALEQLAISDEAEELAKRLNELPSDPDAEETDCDYDFGDDTIEGYGWDKLERYLDPSLLGSKKETMRKVFEALNKYLEK